MQGNASIPKWVLWQEDPVQLALTGQTVELELVQELIAS